MDKKNVVGLVSAISGLLSFTTAQAVQVPDSESPLPKAQSYGELLDPIPNAAAVLRVANAAAAAADRQNSSKPNVRLAYDHHHHHHHHHNYWWWYHHHHHHHYRKYHHHHHHHHHHHYD